MYVHLPHVLDPDVTLAVGERVLGILPADSLPAADVLSRRATTLFLAKGEWEGMDRAHQLALEIVRKRGDPALEISILESHALMLTHQGRQPEALALLRRAIELARTASNPEHEVAAHYQLVRQSLRAGDVRAAHSHAAAALQAAEALRDRLSLFST